MEAALLACALNVSPVTVEAIVSVESGGNPIALNVNKLRGPQPRAASAAEAVRIAEGYIALGYSVDLGMMQVNSLNLADLGYSVGQVLDPCTNIAAGGRILAANYAKAAKQMGEGQEALKAALSKYNTGDFERGFRNGYVARYYGPGAVPALADARRVVTVSLLRAGRKPAAPNPYTADMRVYFTEGKNVGFVQ